MSALFTWRKDFTRVRQQGEPSVEEILRSIKQVIARDDRTDRNEPGELPPFEDPPFHAPLTAAAAAASGISMDREDSAGSADENDIVVHRVDDGPPPAESEEDNPRDASDARTFGFDGNGLNPETRAAQETGVSGRSPGGEEPLLGALAAEAMRDSLAALSQVRRTAAPVPDTNHMLEELVRDLLRPMLAQWLDRNLPTIVEQVVAREIARVTAPRS